MLSGRSLRIFLDQTRNTKKPPEHIPIGEVWAATLPRNVEMSGGAIFRPTLGGASAFEERLTDSAAALQALFCSAASRKDQKATSA
jgi:hypothetical protein